MSKNSYKNKNKNSQILLITKIIFIVEKFEGKIEKRIYIYIYIYIYI